MTGIITLLTGKLLPYLIGAATLILGILGYGWKKKREGRQAEIAKAKAIQAKNLKITKAEAEATQARTDADVRKRLKGRLKK